MHVLFIVTTLSTLLRCGFFSVGWVQFVKLHGTVKQLLHCWTLKFSSFIKKALCFSNYMRATTYVVSRCFILICSVTQTFFRLPLVESYCPKRLHKYFFLNLVLPKLRLFQIVLVHLKICCKKFYAPFIFLFPDVVTKTLKKSSCFQILFFLHRLKIWHWVISQPMSCIQRPVEFCSISCDRPDISDWQIWSRENRGTDIIAFLIVHLCTLPALFFCFPGKFAQMSWSAMRLFLIK